MEGLLSTGPTPSSLVMFIAFVCSAGPCSEMHCTALHCTALHQLSLASDGELVAEKPGNYCTGLVAQHAGYHSQASQTRIEVLLL